MPRALRVQYPGAIYHVMNRGDRQERIFLDDVDRQDWLKTLAEACQKTGWQVHAYCLMSNHFHVVLETPNANLVDGMRWLLSTYTIRLNHRHKLFGHVFSGRYKALRVEGSGNGYLKTACDYVHLNPVRAGLIGKEDRLLAYPWSSLVWYVAAPEHRPGWIRADRLLGEHGIQEDSAAGREQFERRMEQRRLEEEPESAMKAFRRGWCLGSEEFRQQMLELIHPRSVKYMSCAKNQIPISARTATEPIQLIVRNGDQFRVVALDYHGGLRYPHLERDPAHAALLDDILAPRN